MADDTKQRLDILDQLAAIFFSMHDSDSSSDYWEKKEEAFRLLQPLTERREIQAPCAGTVADLEVRDGMSISSWMKSDPLRVGEQKVTAGSIGRIEKVLVKKGDTVAAGQVLLTMRAYRGTP